MKQRLIDASQIENKFLHWLNEISKDITNGIYQGSESDGIAACLEEIRGTPTIDPESLRPTAHWISDSLYVDGKRKLLQWCSLCNCPGLRKTKYCPHCGAKMEG